jgi:TolA-binding protein
MGLRGAYAQSVESLLREGSYDQAIEELDMWEWEFPLERLEGYSSYLRCKYHFGKKEWAKCSKEAALLVGVNPRSNYADKLLMIAAEAYEASGDKTAALKCLRLIVAEYPTSPLVETAKARIAKLGG